MPPSGGVIQSWESHACIFTAKQHLAAPNSLHQEVDFFRKATFNKLSAKAINQLKGRADELGMINTDNLSESVRSARTRHARAYEPWTEKEKDLLCKAMKYTNDLGILSRSFQRAKSSIESCGQRLIYESEHMQESNSNKKIVRPAFPFIELMAFAFFSFLLIVCIKK